ncbi:SMP-30/gluconolactonase/LRE family protein [Oceanobacillus iheyensis]|uniref:Hypothetical conserved protein n=1 Tax=Oceanobacillus iheyensis (strain DSM 14371 / CIP 107618 / JCM 11309 / KCTC 3954 / HTE831) TaxID=221109 RepID=Q8CV23_OCEIH|nr:SMP-30/gluconolactonase/LRE family protein [Oceanobacillus iheyensis]BAC12890.1 hypothetical conserved protein [Oceanobacillus iheyensis HTE831]
MRNIFSNQGVCPLGPIALAACLQVDATCYNAVTKETTELKEGRVVIDLKDIEGSPDGMTIDVNDRLWVALWGGSRVICVDPRLGKIVESITLPVSNVTSCTFGGPKMRTLYITTASEGIGNDKFKLEPLAGSLFSCQVGVQGLASIPYV